MENKFISIVNINYKDFLTASNANDTVSFSTDIQFFKNNIEEVEIAGL